MSEKNLETRKIDILVRQEEILSNKKIFGENNKVWINGIIKSEFEFSHETYGEKFYKNKIRVVRYSGVEDFIPIVVSEVLIADVLNGLKTGRYVEAAGQFRSYNRWGEDGKSHVDLFLFATIINFCEDEEEFEEKINSNQIYLKGTICKPTVFRYTPLGRQITDLIIAVNRNFRKSDYIPCIAWSRTAIRASELEVGDKIELCGRVQSREYFKRCSEDSKEGEYKEAYEISITGLTKIDSDK